jgi:hypothetical protein
LDKIKRKLETDLKSSQVGLEEIERSKRDLQEVLKKKDQELKIMAVKVEDEQSQASNLMKKLKELQVFKNKIFENFMIISNFMIVAKNRRVIRRTRE